MPMPGDPQHLALSAGDPFLELIAETLENVERAARAQFLQRLFKTIAQLDLTEANSLDLWDQILTRRHELADSLNKPVSLKRAMVDVLASSSYLRVPILIEYDELKRLEISAATDALTGLYNRRFFEEHFEKELNRASRYNHNLALVLIDLHQFKEVNDTYGHPQGDLLLQTAANTLRKSLRISDYAFRIGGDEFALLLVQSDSAQAMALARRVRANFAAVIQPMQMNVPIAIDFGVAVYPLDGDRKDVLIRVADEHMYQMKEHSRPGLQLSKAGGDNAPAASMPEPSPEVAQSILSSPATPIMPPPAPAATPIGAGPNPFLEMVDAAAAVVAGISPAEVVAEQPSSALKKEKRKWERVLLGANRAYAEFIDVSDKKARVLDLGYGGVALEMEPAEEVGETFRAVLHVPILPPVRVSLKKLYQLRSEGGQIRIGCAFIT